MSFELIAAAPTKDGKGTLMSGKYILDFETLYKERFEIPITENTTYGEVKEKIAWWTNSNKFFGVEDYVIVYEYQKLGNWFRREGENVVERSANVPILQILNSIHSVEDKLIGNKIPMALRNPFLSLVENNEDHAKYAACLPIATVNSYRDNLTDLSNLTEESRKKYARFIVEKLREGYEKTCKIEGKKEFECPILMDKIKSFPFPYPRTEDEVERKKYGRCIGFYDFQALFSVMLSRPDDDKYRTQTFLWPHNNEPMTERELSFIIQLAHYYYNDQNIDRDWYRIILSSHRDTNTYMILLVSGDELFINGNSQRSSSIDIIRLVLNVEYHFKTYSGDALQSVGIIYDGYHRDSNFKLNEEDEENKSLTITFIMYTKRPPNNELEPATALRRPRLG